MKSPIPFDKLPKDEQNERIQNVANRLARIADQYVSNAESSSEVESPKGFEDTGLSKLEPNHFITVIIILTPF